jgi:hypothetical protein
MLETRRGRLLQRLVARRSFTGGARLKVACSRDWGPVQGELGGPCLTVGAPTMAEVTN